MPHVSSCPGTDVPKRIKDVRAHTVEMQSPEANAREVQICDAFRPRV
jgi:hypothetical protein